MNHVTLPLIIIASLVAGGALGGCYRGIDPVENNHPQLEFQLPEGWEVTSEDPDSGYIAIVLNEPTKDGVVPYVGLETEPWTLRPGTPDQARESIKKDFDERMQKRSIEGWPGSEYKEISLPSGIHIYADIAPVNYWSSHEQGEVFSCGTSFTYSTQGYIVEMVLNDKADLYLDDLDIITKSSRITHP